MDDIINFFVTHWLLSGAFVLALGAYLVFEFMQSNNNDVISPEQVVELINHSHGVVIDVRTPEEFSSGHILHAHNFDLNESDAKLKRLNKYTLKPVILVCAHGKRSAKCLERFRGHGFEQVYSLGGGLQAWQDAGLPLTKG